MTADGRLRTASPSEHPDLFWAVRGAGANLGVVTSFEYRLHDVGPVLGGGVVFPVAKARRVLAFYDEFARGCPDELSVNAVLWTTATPDEACRQTPPLTPARPRRGTRDRQQWLNGTSGQRRAERLPFRPLSGR